MKSKKNSKLSLRKIESLVNQQHNIKLSYVTVKRILNSNNLKAFSPIKKPFLSPNNINRRFDISKTWIKMPIKDVKKIIFSDETKFNLHFSNGKVKVWREPGTGLESDNLLSWFKRNGNGIMVWGCFSYYGVGRIVFIDGVMDAPLYCSILADNLKESVRSMGIDDFIFQQDNDPKHTSRLAKEFFAENNIKLLSWPAQSSDMNPIENLWGLLKEKISYLQPKNLNELKQCIITSWNQINNELTNKLALSFKKRAIVLYRAKERHTKY